MDKGAWKAAVHGVTKSQTRLSNITFTFHLHALEKEMATHSSVLAWRIPGIGEPDGLPSMRSHRVGHDWSDLAAADLVMRHKITVDMARVVGLAYPGCVLVPFQTVMTLSNPTLSYVLHSSWCSFCSKVVSLRASWVAFSFCYLPQKLEHHQHRSGLQCVSIEQMERIIVYNKKHQSTMIN